MPILSHSPLPQRLAPRCPRSTAASPPPASAAIGPSRPSGTLLENGGSAQQSASVIDRRALPDPTGSMDLRALYAGEQELDRLWRRVRLRASRSYREAAR